MTLSEAIMQRAVFDDLLYLLRHPGVKSVALVTSFYQRQLVDLDEKAGAEGVENAITLHWRSDVTSWCKLIIAVRSFAWALAEDCSVNGPQFLWYATQWGSPTEARIFAATLLPLCVPHRVAGWDKAFREKI